MRFWAKARFLYLILPSLKSGEIQNVMYSVKKNKLKETV
jgi:hypothetical protein